MTIEEDEPYFPAVTPEILQKQWTTSHLDTALGQVPGPDSPTPEPPPAPPSED
jgi:hypothetical protein